jgi:hypothetical protein
MTPCEDTNFRTNHPLPNHFGEGKGYAGVVFAFPEKAKVCTD